jgi:hypothetical protein
MKKTKMFAMLVFALSASVFTGCSKDDDSGSSSPFVGTWQSVGYYRSAYYPETTATLISDTSEKLTFNSNGKGVYSAGGTEKAFDWKAFDIGIDISIAPDIHNTDNWDYAGREYYLVSSTELVIIWSNAYSYVYEKISGN